MSCTCTGDCCCGSDCCPELVPVTVEETNVTIEGAGLAITVGDTVPAAATKKLITAQVDVAGHYQIEFWFVDTDDEDAVESLVAPDDPGVTRFKKVTDAAGEIQFVVENAVLRTWYLIATLGNGVVLSAAITVGV